MSASPVGNAGDYHDSTRTRCTTVAPQPLLKTLDSAKELPVSELAQKIVELQLQLYYSHKPKATKRVGKVASLFDSVSDKLADSLSESDDPEEDIKTILESLPPSVLQRSVWKWEKLPYAVLCSAVGPEALSAPGGQPASSDADRDIDEWVIRNERSLRESKTRAWNQGLVKLSSHADNVFKRSVVTDTSRTIPRHPSTTGYTFLDKKRATSVQIQPSTAAFAKRFAEMSDGLLSGLDWSNLCVAGGIVLGALLCVSEPGASAHPEQWKDSDIDVYVYGLSPLEANEKIRHIFEVYTTNLPAGAPVLVVRNSKTITFFSQYPLRRLQIVLKLVQSPKDVLLNFDLDICSMCWDGSEVWMLPRACRALETGYNVFTMNLIHGHYLGERRATQETRVFKYAHKGYGIRILPSYIESLKTSATRLRELSTYSNVLTSVDIDAIAARARDWTGKVLRHSGASSHASLDMRNQITEAEQNRSCLSGFELLMRHVALWEAECAGKIQLQNQSFASVSYDEWAGDVGYDDTPQYEWGVSFNIDTFKRTIVYFNDKERGANDFGYNFAKGTPVQRMTTAASIDELFKPSCDIVIPIYLDGSFVKFANTLIVQSLQDHGLFGDGPLSLAPLQANSTLDPSSSEVPYLWCINSLTMWQQLDRRIDEIHEVLWALRRANQMMHKWEAWERRENFKLQAARRAIRATPGEEFDEFARWIGRTPEPLYCNYGGPEMDFPGSDEDEEWGEDE